MSDKITFEVQPRDAIGKSVKALRRENIVPAVIHNHGKESTHVQADYNALAKIVKQAGRNHPVELTVDGKKVTVLIKTVDRDPRLHTITHVVFNAVRANQKVEAEVPVEAKYDEGEEASPAEKAGLIVLAQADIVEVKALPKDLPSILYFDAAKLVEVGDQVTVAELDLPAGVEVVTDAEHVLATVFEPSALAAANEAAAGDAEEAAPASEGEESAAESTEEPKAEESKE